MLSESTDRIESMITKLEQKMDVLLSRKGEKYRVYLIQKLKEIRSKNLSTVAFSKEELNYILSKTISYLISKLDARSENTSYLNLTSIPEMDVYIPVLIRYGVLDNNYVLDKEENRGMPMVDLLEKIARVKSIQYRNYIIPDSANEFADLKKDSSYAQLVYKMASL